LEAGIGTIVSNRAEVETSGLDFELLALPLPNLTLGAGLLYMHKYEISAGPNKGSDLAYTADISYNLSATFVLPACGGGTYLRADYSYMDDHLTNTGSTIEERYVQDREDLNAKLGWRNDRWNIALWGKNLTDNEYALFTAATYPVTGMNAYFLAPPRTYGATLRYEF
jgi:iron complex outermembrane receptor protein